MGEMRKPQIPHSTEISYKKRHAQFSYAKERAQQLAFTVRGIK